MIRYGLISLALCGPFLALPASAAETCSYHRDRCTAYRIKTGDMPTSACDKAYRACLRSGQWVGVLTGRVLPNIVKE